MFVQLKRWPCWTCAFLKRKLFAGLLILCTKNRPFHAFLNFWLGPVSENPSMWLKEHLKISEVAKFESLRLWVTHVKNVKKLGVHRIRFSELILSFSGHISTLLTAAQMPKLDAPYTEKLEIFYLPTLIFCSFFHNLSESGRESGIF